MVETRMARAARQKQTTMTAQAAIKITSSCILLIPSSACTTDHSLSSRSSGDDWWPESGGILGIGLVAKWR